jgi:2-C-methyl-D-erythritol 4-phosphate cytidylyltransferase / 2-C-methyl-D-erythritol 2,4-cyclodiphosphate synthase
MSEAVAVLVAAGSSTRLGGSTPKQFLDLGGMTVAARAARTLGSCPGVDGVVVVLAPAEMGSSREADLRAIPGVRSVVPGGASRALSSLAGVEAASGASFVLVHDAARPFVSHSLVRSVLAATKLHGAAVPAVAVADTVKRDDGSGFVSETLERAALRLAQTPQGSRRDWLLDALRGAAGDGVEVTDEAQALERAGRRVALVAGDPGNLKITSAEDWVEATRRVDPPEGDLRVGHGYDVHRFGGDRELILGGVAFPGAAGLAGHSDADVVLHAAMDAVLGAAALPDIGHHFPPGDPRFAGADSVGLAREVAATVAAHGWRIVNLDLTLLAETPKIRARVDAMRAAIAGGFGVAVSRVGVKATTLEGLGSLGRAEGIACHAVALLRRVAERP